MSSTEALQIARERNLDLVQVTEKVEPPVCRIVNYGKYIYLEQKKERKSKKQKVDQFKEVRISFNISQHDLEVKASQASKFLKKGSKIRVGMVLRGRQKRLNDFAKGKMNKFLEILNSLTPIKTERELKREPRGFTIIISKA